MGLFDFLKKSPEPIVVIAGPYKDSSTNLIYNLLFCDNLELYKTNTKKLYNYPFNILFSENSAISELQKIIDDSASEARVKLLSYSKQLAFGTGLIKMNFLP